MKPLNKSFLVKLGAKIVTDLDALWVRVLRTKYKCFDELPMSIHRNQASHLWRGLSAVWEDVVEGMEWVVGDGRHVRFWYDKWGGNQPLISHLRRDQWPRNPMCNVQDMATVEGEWDWSRFATMIPKDVVDNIAAIKPPNATNGRDQLAWRHSLDGKCSVRSVYWQQEHDSWETEDRQWMMAWKWDGPERIRTFLWLLLRGAILTNENRIRRCMADSMHCEVCGCAVENLEHIFRGCHGTEQLWRLLVPKECHGWFWIVGFDEWLRRNLACSSKVKDCSWSTLFGAILWHMWKRRNSMIFANKWLSNDAVMSLGVTLAQHVAGTNVRSVSAHGGEQVELAWVPPADGWCKVNTDGSVKQTNLAAAAGGVIRDCHGSWLGGFARNIGRATVIQAELWGAYEGLRLAWELGYKHVLLELDNLSVVKFVNRGTDHVLLQPLICSIRELLERNWMVRIAHVYRERNCLADSIANFALTLPVGYHRLLSTPELSKPILFADVLGISKPRLIFSGS